eukprot:981480-Lingulodinium_polyedra.AAC.1
MPGHEVPAGACLTGAPGKPAPCLAPGDCPKGSPGREESATNLVPGACPSGAPGHEETGGTCPAGVPSHWIVPPTGTCPQG